MSDDVSLNETAALGGDGSYTTTRLPRFPDMPRLS